MIKVIPILFLLLFLGTATGAQQIPKSFSHLAKLDVGENGYVFIYYNVNTSKLLNQTVESFKHPDSALRVLETKLDTTKEEIYTIDFDDGPSGDPEFIIHRKVDKSFDNIGSFTGTELIVPGDGSIYVSGEENRYFNMRRKYLLKNGRLKEVIQPYYYVGLKTVNSQPLDLYADRSYTEKVTNLPAKSEIEVLMASANDEYSYDFLIKTSYGLLGWAHLSDQCGTEIVEGICFHGD